MRFHQRASHLRRKIAMLKKSFATLKLGGAKRIYQHLSARRSKVRQARTGVGSGSITHKDYFVLQLRGGLS
jgi:hypothetical protein